MFFDSLSLKVLKSSKPFKEIVWRQACYAALAKLTPPHMPCRPVITEISEFGDVLSSFICQTHSVNYLFSNQNIEY